MHASFSSPNNALLLVQPANWTIFKLVSMFMDKQIQLPEMQRRYVWRSEKARALIDSIYKDYPSGSILLWETDDVPETRETAVSFDAENHLQTRLLLLDGQQRITSLATVMTGIPIKVRIGNQVKEKPIEVYFNMNHPEVMEEYSEEYEEIDDADVEDDLDEEENAIDNEKLIFQLKSKKIENKQNWIPVTKLFKEGVGSIIKDKKIDPTDPNYEKYLNRLNKLYGKKDNYFYPVQILQKEKNYAEVTEVFVRVNSSGTKLRGADLALAQVTSRWHGAMKLFTDVVADCQNANFDLDEGFLIKCLVSVSTWQNKFQMINKIPITQLQNDWEKTKKGLEFTINFLKENAKIETSAILPSPYFLIPIVCLAVKHHYRFSLQLERQVLRWFYAASMWGRYSRGASESALDEDLSVIKKSDSIQGMVDNVVSMSGRLEVKDSDLEGKNINSTFFVMSYVLTRRNNAKDWGSGVTFSLQHMGKEFKNEYDHIFPRSKLEPYLMKKHNDKQLVKKLVNDMANIAFLSKRNNQIKKDKNPQEYFRAVINERGEEALTAQHITLDESLWSLDRYDDFLRDRRKRIAEGINSLMKSLEKEEEPKEKTLSEILHEGENFNTEFKSSLRWDYKQNQINKGLEYSILKTLTAFMNSDGGTLYVGVDNDGIVLGIQKDYDIFDKNNNWDGWSQTFTNMINSNIGKEFNKYIKAEPIVFDGKTIVKITISRSSTPTYIDPENKSEFHIRAGTTTQLLNLKQATAYIKDHWND